MPILTKVPNARFAAFPAAPGCYGRNCKHVRACIHRYSMAEAYHIVSVWIYFITAARTSARAPSSFSSSTALEMIDVCVMVNQSAVLKGVLFTIGKAWAFNIVSCVSHSVAMREAGRLLFKGNCRTLPLGVFNARLSSVTTRESPRCCIPTSFQNLF